MQLRFGLPLIQTIAMTIILWAPWSPQTPKVDLVLRDGREIKTWTLLPGPDFNAIAWAQGGNLPALPAEIPIDLSSEKFPRIYERNWRFFSFWVFGALCWYMVGRCTEDIASWRVGAMLPACRRGDLTFAIESALVSTLSPDFDS